MNQSFYGSICVTDILDALKLKNTSFSKGRNGKIYMNTTVWLNEQKDEYGNILSVQANPGKDSKDKKFYVGNFKKSENSKPINDNDIDKIPDDFNIKSSDKDLEKTFIESADNVKDQLPF